MKRAADKGRIYEDQIAKEIGGKRQPMSGAHWAGKEDLVTEEYLWQLKNVSGQKSHSVKRNDLKDLKKNASRLSKIGVYLLNFGEGEEYVVIPRDFFLSMDSK